MRHYTSLLCLAAFAGTVAHAQDNTDPFKDPSILGVSKKADVTATLLSDATAIAPGQAFTVALTLNHAEGWHGYWTNSGDIELGASLKLVVPEGFTVSSGNWPVPEITRKSDKVNYDYTGTVQVYFQVTPPVALPTSGSSEFTLGGRYQYCRDGACVLLPKAAYPSLTIPHAAAEAMDAAVTAAFTADQAKHLPKPLSGLAVTAYQTPTGYALYGKGEVPAEAEFLSVKGKVVAEKLAQNLTKGNGEFVLNVAKHPEAEANATELAGLLKLGEAAFQFSAPVVAGTPPLKGDAATGEPAKSLGVILLYAFIGGLILNLMPCVFPVIGIKIMDFVKQAGQDPWKVKLHGLIFSLGILLTFWLLAGLVSFLGLSWGGQLQNKWVVFGLMLVMFVFAVNMYGVFEIGTSATGVGQGLTAKKGYVGSFFKGALAVVVSTPCSAPFLATALSAVIALPPLQIFVVFSFIALGLASPYILLTSSPRLLKLLPKPGEWMESFKQLMSFLMFGAAGFLLWIYQGLVSESNGLHAVIGLSIIGMGLYVHGRWNNFLHAGKTKNIAAVAAVLLLLMGGWLAWPSKDLSWQAWSPDLEKKLIAEGKTVYVDFTARWCATCQTNKASYKNSAVKQLIADKNIQLLKADWTDYNDTIRNEIEGRYQRSAIPVNVLLVPGAEKPVVLPEILTSGTVQEYFTKAP
jgi:thiol:disulfide interchange protein